MRDDTPSAIALAVDSPPTGLTVRHDRGSARRFGDGLSGLLVIDERVGVAERA